MERRFNFVPGEYYHIFNRGIEKRLIFLDENDKKRFQRLLYLSNTKKRVVYKLIRGEPLEYDRGEPLVSVLAYVLMPNHFHLIVREGGREGNVSKFMGKVSTAYSMFFNTKYERSGALMCRPFRAKHIDSDDYFRWLWSYVHLNPMLLALRESLDSRRDQEKIDQHLGKYLYSSYLDHYGKERIESRLLDMQSVPVDIADLENLPGLLKQMAAFQGESLE